MRVQTIIGNSGTPSAIASKRRIANDLDYLVARLHARRSRMAEAKRLDDLCRIRSLPEFFHTIFPGSEFKGILDFQRLLVYELISELSGFRAHMSGPGADLTRLDAGSVPGGKFEGIDPGMFDKDPHRRVIYASRLPPQGVSLGYPRTSYSGISGRFCPAGPKGTPSGKPGKGSRNLS